MPTIDRCIERKVFFVCSKPLLGKQNFHIFQFPPYFNMGGESSSHRVRREFFFTYTCQLHEFGKMHDFKFESFITIKMQGICRRNPMKLLKISKIKEFEDQFFKLPITSTTSAA